MKIIRNFLDRLKKEHQELNDKLMKLDKFMTYKSRKFNKLSKRQQELMKRQYELMAEYKDVLTERIELAEAEKEDTEDEEA